MDCYPIRLGRLAASLACLLILSCSFCSFGSELGSKESPSAHAEGRERLLQLRAEIAYHDDLYYKKAAPEISDAEYDALKRELRRLEALYPEAAVEESVGDDRAGRFPEVAHLVPMLSLEKAYSESELLAFHRRVVAEAGTDDVVYSVEPKMDGMAISVVYEDGVFVRALTRGDGVKGEDISENALRIAGLPRRLSGERCPRQVELRGEVFVRFEDFREVNVERLEAGEEAFSHPRSMAAGSAKLGDPREVAGRRLSIVFFGLGAFEADEAPPATQAEFYERAKEWGLPVLETVVEVKGEAALLQAVEAMQQERLALPYPTDGTVVKVDSFALQDLLGASRSAPHWALAYKSSGRYVETRLLGVRFQVGRSGALTPVAELEAVELAGSTVQRASLHNFAELERLDLRAGDFVYLEKAGEIIPQVVGVDFAKREPESRPFVRPVDCPFCGRALFREDGRAKVYCLNEACPERVKRRLEHFVSRGAVAMEGWGAATVAGLVDKGYARDIADLYRVDASMLVELEHVGEESAERLLRAREASKNAELWRVVYGLGISGIGDVRARQIAARLSGLEELAGLEVVEEDGAIEAALAAYFEDVAHREELERLVGMGVGIRSDNTGAEEGGSLSGKVFVFTGRLASFTRAEATDLVTRAGGAVRSSVTSECDYLVVGAAPGKKREDAEERGIVVLGEADFLALLRQSPSL